jgi:hypothetical protein
MKQKQIVGKIFIIFLFSLLMIPSLKFVSINAFYTNNPCKNQKCTTLTINNFNNFELIQDSEYIESTLTSSELSFVYEGTTSSWVTERYIYTFNSFGNCTDLLIQVNIEYSLSDINDHINVGLLVGSYYNSTGDFIGAPPIYGDQI